VGVISTTEDDGLSEFAVARLSTTGPARLLRSVATVRRLIAEQPPDVLHCHYINEAGWFGAAAGYHPLIITAWGSDLYRAPQESRLARHLNPWTVRRADHVTCDSHDQAERIRGWGVPGERVDVIGWGVDRREFHLGLDRSRFRARHDIPADAPVVLSPRRWHPNCNIAAIVQAHARLPDDVFLLLKRFASSDPQVVQEVRAAVRTSPAAGRVRIVEELAPPELPELYAAADVVVSLCETDGTPVSVLEAMACGCVVVALRNASLAEWVSGPGGALVDDLDAQSVASAVLTFLSDPSLRGRASKHNVQIVAGRADRDAEFERMDGIYRRLAAGHQRAR
jgi:glycosyltransferase involved in cell wall biosynthesis